MTTITNRPAGLVALERVSDMLRPMARGLTFSQDNATGETVVRVVDTQTNEVLRQIPNEDAIAMARALDRVQGLFVRVKA
jgi:flagellar protein FlaG